MGTCKPTSFWKKISLLDRQRKSNRSASLVQLSQDIAIIGMAAEMPKSPDLKQFWDHLLAGIDLIDEVPYERWGCEAFFNALQPQIKWGGFIANVHEFDAEFFHISPLEAELMDPQQRRFLQIVWQTIADAGMTAEDFSESQTGVFVGAMNTDYCELLAANDIPTHEHIPKNVPSLTNLLLTNTDSLLG